MLVKGNTLIFALVGNNISHSFSPLIHNYLIKTFDVNAIYIPIELKSNISNFFRFFSEVNNFSGANITIPFKEEAYNFTKVIDNTSKKIGAINTIKKASDNILSINTDYLGFLYSLYNDLNFNPENKKIVVLGSGGTAKTVVNSLSDKVNNIIVISRNKRNINFNEKIKWIKFYNDKRTLSFPEADLIINATPLGVKGEKFNINWDSLKKDCSVFDLLYIKTELINSAKKAGLNVTNGLNMLIYQAIKSFEFWTNLKLEDNILITVKKEVLNE